MTCIVGWITTYWTWLIEVPIMGAAYMIGNRVLGKPQIIIEEVFTVGFNPSRCIWEIQISNKALRRWQEFLLFKRKSLQCWIEADFIVNDEIPSIGIKAASTTWDKDTPNNIILRPNSMPYTIELISKIHGQYGFYIKSPISDNLVTFKDVLVIVTIRIEDDEIIKAGVWVISDKGKSSWDLDCERLG